MAQLSQDVSNADVKQELQKSLRALDIQRKALESEVEGIVSELNAIPVEGGKPMGIDTPLVDDEGYPRSDIDVYRARHLRNRFHQIRTDHKAIMSRVEDGLKKVSLFVNPTKKEEDLTECKARLAPKPKPKFDPISGKWLVSNWNGTVAGVSDGHLRSFNGIPGSIAKMQISSIQPSTSQRHPTTAISQNTNTTSILKIEEIPFALVDEVFTNSPASAAGLKQGDMIVKFGTAIYSNHRQLRAIAEMIPLAASEERLIPITVLRKRKVEGDNVKNNEKDSGLPMRLQISPRPWNGRGLIGCHIKPL